MNRLYVHQAGDVRMRVVDITNPKEPLGTVLEVAEGDLVWVEGGDDAPLDAAASVEELGLARGAHVFQGRCSQVKVKLHYGEDKEHSFGVGVPLSQVLRWAVGEKGFDIDPDDADELGLQVCGTDERPDLSEHIGSFADDECTACFTIVPKDRFQG